MIRQATGSGRRNVPQHASPSDHQTQQPSLVKNSKSTQRRRPGTFQSVFWKCAIPIVILYSVFTVMDRFMSDIDDVYSAHPTSTSNNPSSAGGDASGRAAIPPKATREERVAERQRKREENRKHRAAGGKLSSRSGYVGSSSSFSENAGGKNSNPVQDEPDDEPPFDYNQKMVRTKTTLSDPTADYSANVHVILVLSARENFQRRAVIRKTWGRDHAIYFVIGGKPESEQQAKVQGQLEKEQKQHHDLLDSVHPESYKSLPHKVKFAYQWILKNCPRVQWLTKVDDDTVVRVDTLQRVLLNKLNSLEPIVVGRIVSDSPVYREGKWAETKYQPDTYPNWPQGSCGHTVSRPVADYIGSHNKLVYYQGEDTSIGIWLDQAADKGALAVTWLRSHYYTNDGDCHSPQWLIIGHRIKPTQMLSCYQRMDEWKDEAVDAKLKNLWFMETLEQRNGLYSGGDGSFPEDSPDEDAAGDDAVETN